MERVRRAAALALLALSLSCAPQAQPLPLPEQLISLASDEGARLLLKSDARRAYWPLSIQFVTQKNQAYCGVATMVMVLNALAIKAPPAPGLEPFATFTQDNVLNEQTERILPQAALARRGMTLDQLAGLLETHDVSVEVRHADQSSLDEFRAAAIKHLRAANRHVVVNYLRRAIGQESGGHISPLAAYDAESDRFLILDVSRYKSPPAWVKAVDLFAAMNTVDSDNNNRRRGFVLISPRAISEEPAQRERSQEVPAPR